MNLGLFLKFMHVLAAFWMISGMLGRGITFSQAARTRNLHSVNALLSASDFFERRMVIPGSNAVFLLGLLTAWMQRWPLFGVFQGIQSGWLLASILFFLLLMVPVPLYLLPRRKQRARALEDSLAQGQITTELNAEIHNRGVTYFRSFELVVVIVILFLMVVKPF